MVTMRDVAERAGVATITVSRVVNGADAVGEQTRQKVEAAIAELHYVPNRVASNLRSQKSDTIALVLPDITNAFWTSIARGAEDEAWSGGHGVFICNTDNQFQKEDGYIQRLLQRRVHGMLLVPAPRRDYAAQLGALTRHRVNYILVHKKPSSVDSNVVRTDGEKAAYELTTHLLRFGSTRISFVGLPFADPPSEDRFNGYRRALRERGIRQDLSLVRLGESNKGSGGFRIVSELLQNGTRPDGILIANSRLAVGGVKAITQAGLTIGQDINVAAFHDISALDDYASQLITAVQPAYDMGRYAARRLLEMYTDAYEPLREIVLDIDIRLPSRPPTTLEHQLASR